MSIDFCSLLNFKKNNNKKRCGIETTSLPFGGSTSAYGHGILANRMCVVEYIICGAMIFINGFMSNEFMCLLSQLNC